jgi:hypothetical protein
LLDHAWEKRSGAQHRDKAATAARALKINPRGGEAEHG